MPNTTTRLKLVEPYGYEAFKRTDFETNWGILDNFPGVQIVSSSAARPSTSAAQAGMLLYQASDRMLSASESGAWVPLRQYAFITAFNYSSNDNVAKGTTKSYPASPWTLTMPRAGGIAFMGTVRLGQQAGFAQTVLYKPYINGVDSDLTPDDQSTVRFPDAGSGASSSLVVPFSVFGYRGGLAKGSTVSIQIKVTCGTVTTDAIAFSGAKIICFFTDA